LLARGILSPFYTYNVTRFRELARTFFVRLASVHPNNVLKGVLDDLAHEGLGGTRPVLDTTAGDRLDDGDSSDQILAGCITEKVVHLERVKCLHNVVHVISPFHTYNVTR